MTGKRKSKRAVTMSHTMKVIRNAHPGMPEAQVLSMASKQLSNKNKTGGKLPILPLGIGTLTGLIVAKNFRSWPQYRTTERNRNSFKTVQMNKL